MCLNLFEKIDWKSLSIYLWMLKRDDQYFFKLMGKFGGDFDCGGWL